MQLENELYDKDLRDYDIEQEEALLTEMGLTRHETEKLRNTMLSADEAVAAKSEELTTTLQHKGMKKNWEEFVDSKARMGQVMHHSEFIRRLRTIVPNLLVVEGRVRGKISLMYTRNTPRAEMPLYEGKIQDGNGYFTQVIYIGWISQGTMPEYEIDIVDEFNRAISQKRGWRTVLLRMIQRWNMKLDRNGEPELDLFGQQQRVSRASIITEEQALEAFGQPSNGPTSYPYREQIHAFRNAHPQVAVERR